MVYSVAYHGKVQSKEAGEHIGPLLQYHVSVRQARKKDPCKQLHESFSKIAVFGVVLPFISHIFSLPF